MALYIGSVKYAPTRAIYRGFWAINVHGFAGTEVDFNGTKQYIGSNEITSFKVTNEGRYIIRATRQGQVKTRIIVIVKEDTDYIKDIGLYVGFKELQYIESSGTQYIDTGFVPDSNTKVETEISIPSGNPQVALLGARNSVNTTGRYIYDIFANVSTLQKARFQYSGAGAYNDVESYAQLPSETKVKIIKDKEKNYIDGVEQPSNAVDSFSCQYPMYLFSINTAGTPTVMSSLRIYSCKIYDNGTLVRDFIPVVDDTNTPCMYDRVSQTMYYNAGTGTFTAGPDMYQELQYIQGTCNVQYINTGVAPTTDMNIYVKCGVASITAGASYSPFGSRETAGASDGVGIFVGSGSNTRVDSFYFLASASDRWQVNNVASVDDVYETTFDGSTQTLIKNGTSLGSYTYTPVNTTIQPMYVNALNNAGTLQNGQWGSRIYRFTVDGYIDLIPVKRLTDNAVGMYDIINNKFYGNAGTGSFSAGPAKE